MTKLTKLLSGLFALLSAFVVGANAQTTTVVWDPTVAGSAAATVALEGNSGTVEGSVEGYALQVDATAGKMNSAQRSGDFQINATVVIKIPVFTEGDVITLTNFGGGHNMTYSIGAETGIDADSKTYTASKAEAKAGFVTMTVTKSGYFRKFQVEYQPRVESATPGTVYENKAVAAVWDFNNASTYATVSSVTPADVFAQTSFDLGNATVSGTGISSNLVDVVFVKVKAATGQSDVISWNVKPAKGLTFTPTKVSGKINRGATDAQHGVIVSVKKEGGDPVALGTYTAWRYNRTTDDTYSKNADIANSFDITLTAEQQAALATSGTFSLISTLGVGATKEGFFSDIHIEGLVSGTVAAVEKFTVTSASNIEGAGSVSTYPVAAEFEAGDEVVFTATDNFGYDFVNWTDKDGNVLSTDAKFTYTVKASDVVTANFKAVETYALNVTVVDGNDYMVQLSPAATVVDGKTMYEAGTKVSLTAISNEVVKFASWSTGSTSSALDVTMDKDVDVTATFAASDLIAIWDFYLPGKEGRVADFASEGNESAALSMYNEAGESLGWLDKCQTAGGYEGQPGAVCWVKSAVEGDVGHHYWQTKVNAANFTNVKVKCSMAYNFNAKNKWNVDYSLDGSAWTTLGTISIPSAKNWVSGEFTLPEAANNQAEVHLRWVPAADASVAGSSSVNDGAALGAIYVTGTAKLVDDGKAPVLVSTVPVDGANTASANGKIVLTFDEKVVVAEGVKGSLTTGESSISLEPTVSGKVVTFEYRGLSYSTEYAFSLPANAVADLTGNAIATATRIEFSTRTKPAVDKKLYDFVVPRDGTFAEAITAANTRADKNTRFRIFVMDGSYTIPADQSKIVTVEVELANGTKEPRSYADPRTTLSASNVSIIGSDYANVVIDNECPTETFVNRYGDANISEGIGNGDVLINRGSDNYFQGITIKRSIGDARGRDIAYNDFGNKTIFKDACLWGYQDTYVSNNENGRFYFEGGVIRGRTDYVCGKGDVFYNEVTLQQCGQGGYPAVPSVARQYGYVFKDCYIKKETADVTYYLGRPWGKDTPSALFIDTKVDAAPIAAGWAEMSGGWPARMAEYNTHLANGSVVDLSARKTVFAETHPNNPILTAEEAAALTIGAVMGGTDDWDPQALAEQVSAPTNVRLNGVNLSWDANPYALLFAICKNGVVVDFTIENSYVVDDASASYSVRSANEMGGLGEAGDAKNVTADQQTAADCEVVNVEIFDINGHRLAKPVRGVNIFRATMSDGSVEVRKVVVK